MKRSIFLILCLWCTMYAFAQSLTVTGVVVDNTGQSAIGATVVEEGTDNGTITNLDGQFTLTVEKGKTLVISYVGFATQRVRVTSEKQLKIILHEDSELLDEVVVVGYGVKQKRSTMCWVWRKAKAFYYDYSYLEDGSESLAECSPFECGTSFTRDS